MATNVLAFRSISARIAHLTPLIAIPSPFGRTKMTITLRNVALRRPCVGWGHMGHSTVHVAGHPGVTAKSTKTNVGWQTHRRDLLLQSSILLLGSPFDASAFGSESIFNIVATQYGKEFFLSQFAGKVVCIVNVASE